MKLVMPHPKNRRAELRVAFVRAQRALLQAQRALSQAQQVLSRAQRALSQAQRALRIHLANALYLPLLLQQFRARRNAPVRRGARPAGGLPMKMLPGNGSATTASGGRDNRFQAGPPVGGHLDQALAAAIHRVVLLELWSAAGESAMCRALAHERYDDVVTAGLGAGSASAVQAAARFAAASADSPVYDEDLQAAFDLLPKPARLSLAELKALLADAAGMHDTGLETCADMAARLSGLAWKEQVAQRVSHWAGRYLAPTSGWRSPFRDQPPLEAWLAEMAIDCSDAVLGLRSAQVTLGNLSPQPLALIAAGTRCLRIPEALTGRYLQSLLTEAVACLPPASELRAAPRFALNPQEFLTHLLAVRLAWELILFREFEMEGAELAWRRVLTAATRPERSQAGADVSALCLAAGTAFEHAEHRRIAERLRRPGSRAPASRISSPCTVFAATRDADALTDSGLEVRPYDVEADRDFSGLESLMLDEIVPSARSLRCAPWGGRRAIFISAPVTAINRVIETHASVRNLVDNGWIHLFAVYDCGAVVVRYDGDLHWAPTTVQDVA
jgi:hypothetical protein